MKSENLEILKKGGVGVILTDTVFGLVGQALKPETVKRIYKIKGRSENKPLIILISDILDLHLFNIKITDKQREKLTTWWPGPVSVILQAEPYEFEYLHRGLNTLSFRLPNDKNLISILKETGPLVAPSANPQGFIPAKNITDAQGYFGNTVDFYEETKELPGGDPSTLIRLSGDGKCEVLRASCNFKC